MLNHGKMNLFFVIGSNHIHDQSNRQGIIQILRKKGFAITEVKQSFSCNHSAEEKDNPCNFQPYPFTDEKDTQEEELLGSSKKSYESEMNETVHNTNEDNSHFQPYPSTDLTWVIPAILSAFIFGVLTTLLTSCICRRAHTRGEPR